MALDQRRLVVNRDRQGCMLADDGVPLAWYPHLSDALDMARLLAEASALRAGPPARIELHDRGRPPRRIADTD